MLSLFTFYADPNHSNNHKITIFLLSTYPAYYMNRESTNMGSFFGNLFLLFLFTKVEILKEVPISCFTDFGYKNYRCTLYIAVVFTNQVLLKDRIFISMIRNFYNSAKLLYTTKIYILVQQKF